MGCKQCPPLKDEQTDIGVQHQRLQSSSDLCHHGNYCCICVILILTVHIQMFFSLICHSEWCSVTFRSRDFEVSDLCLIQRDYGVVFIENVVCDDPWSEYKDWKVTKLATL